VQAYNTLFSGTGKVSKDEGKGLDRTHFRKDMRYALRWKSGKSQRDLRPCGMNNYEQEPATGYCVKRFDGGFSSDRLPTKPRLLVSNTDPSNMHGEHRIAICVHDDVYYGEYFDSLRRVPTRLFERYIIYFR